MDKVALTRALNELMDRFVKDPGKFEHEFETVNRHLLEQSAGQEPTYGAVVADYLENIDKELSLINRDAGGQ